MDQSKPSPETPVLHQKTKRQPKKAQTVNGVRTKKPVRRKAMRKESGPADLTNSKAHNGSPKNVKRARDEDSGEQSAPQKKIPRLTRCRKIRKPDCPSCSKPDCGNCKDCKDKSRNHACSDRPISECITYKEKKAAKALKEQNAVGEGSSLRVLPQIPSSQPSTSVEDAMEVSIPDLPPPNTTVLDNQKRNGLDYSSNGAMLLPSNPDSSSPNTSQSISVLDGGIQKENPLPQSSEPAENTEPMLVDSIPDPTPPMDTDNIEDEVDAIYNKGICGTINLHIVKCGLSGPPDTGKTHVRALMLGRKRPRERKSTAVATKADQVTPDLTINMKTTSRGSHQWHEVKDEHMAMFIARTLIKEEYTDEDSNVDEENSTTPPSCSRSSAKKVSKIIRMIKKSIKEHLQGNTKGKRHSGLNGIRLMYLIDVGGQPQFQEILPNFVRCDINLLVHKLSQDLKYCPEFNYVYNKKNYTVPDQVRASNIDIIKQSARSICSNISSSSITDCKPHIAILGTFKDKCDRHGYNDMLKSRSGTIKKALEPYLGTSDIKKCEFIDSSRDQCIFDIDGSLKGWDDNDCILNHLKQCIHNYAEKRSISVPIRYFIFHHMLTSYAQKHGLQYLTLDQCSRVASEVFMNKSDVDAALNIFDDCNLLLYFPEVLPNIVFTDPTFLFTRTTDLIVASFRCESLTMNRGHIRFQKYGIFFTSLLKNIDSLKLPDKSFTQQHFLKLLTGLYIIADLGPEGYFMPCVLPLCESSGPLVEDIKKTMIENEVDGPLMISFLLKKSPRGLFCALLVALAGNSRWKLNVKTCVHYRNFVVFKLYNTSDKAIIGEVGIIDKDSHLEIYSTCNRKYCSYVRQIVHEALQRACENMKYAISDDINIGLPCHLFPSCDGSHSTIVYHGERKERCPNRHKRLPLLDNRFIWFDSQSQKSYQRLSSEKMFQEYVQGLPESLLKRQLDYDSNGVDHDLIAIAEHMINWEVDLVAPMKLTEIDVHDIRYHDHRPIMQRREALRIWKRTNMLDATYEKLLKLFINAQRPGCADAVCKVLKKKTTD